VWREILKRILPTLGRWFQSGHHPEVEELALMAWADLVNSARTQSSLDGPLGRLADGSPHGCVVLMEAVAAMLEHFGRGSEVRMAAAVRR
jgi:hypothetical protein